jgi:signal transduction histidine kinase
MKDGTIPYEIQGKYLNIILFETERLSNLTNDLLDLSNFENKGVRLIWERFDIVKMLKQSSATFEGKCSQKNMKIRLVFPENELYAYADKGKIQQVVHNLIDNAIKFSKPDSVVTVVVAEKRDKVLVSVKDTGIGIPKDAIGKIWERFYKTDLSRGKDKRGTGLGLSITKQIIAAHNENIKVISTEGEGTEFVFSLQRADS